MKIQIAAVLKVNSLFFTLAATAVCIFIYPYVSSWWATIFTVTNRSVRNFYVNIHMSLKNISLAWELNWAAEKTRKSNIWYHHKISQEIFKGPNIYLSRCAVSLFFSFTLVFFFQSSFRGSLRVKNSTLFSIVFAACFCGFLAFFLFFKKKLRAYI